MLTRLRERFRALLTLDESPERLALAFAIGLFIAFSPLIGMHTLMAVFLVWACRFNAVAMFAGAFVNNPWTLVPMYGACLWFGMLLWPIPEGLPPIRFEELTMQGLLAQFRPYLMPFVVGSTVVGVIASMVGYFVMKYIIVNYRKNGVRDDSAH